MNVGAVVLKHRKKNGLSQPGLAQISGCSSSTIYMIETNKYDGRLSTLDLIANALKVPLWQLIKEAEEFDK